MTKHILILPGDGIGPEIVGEAIKVLDALIATGAEISYDTALIGGAAIDACGIPLPDSTLEKAQLADAILLGAVGGPKWESLDISIRPEKALLGLRSKLELFANLRPAILSKQLAAASSLKAELVEDLDLLIVRELTGGIYFGQAHGTTWQTVKEGVSIPMNILNLKFAALHMWLLRPHKKEIIDYVQWIKLMYLK
jgi:3-isopropylmalate dehydrogenase